MSNLPILSVIIAAYRAQGFIVDAVTSALTQRRVDIEILIAPDEPRSATDYSFLTQLDPCIRVLPDVSQSTGPGPARNRALDVARGEFVALLDADDLWSPDYLERLLPRAREKGAAFGRTRITDWGGGLVREVAAKTETVEFDDFATAYGSFHGIARREDRRWRDVLAEDVLFDLESLSLAGGDAPFVPDAVYQLRLRPESATRDESFTRGIGRGYDRLAGMIAVGETAVAPAHQTAAIAVFRNWQRMNAAFEEAVAAGTAGDFQGFVTAKLRGR